MSWIKVLLILIAFSQFEMGKCFKMYDSTLKRDNTKDVSGLQLLENQIKNIDWSTGITICTRFNYKKIIYSYLFSVGQNKAVSITLGYPNSGLEVGYHIDWQSFKIKSERSIFLSIDEWNHLCLAIDRKSNKYHIYMVRNMKLFLLLKTYVNL